MMISSGAIATSVIVTEILAIMSSAIPASSPRVSKSLNHSADLVARNVSDTLSPDLRDALNAWVDAARGLAAAIGGNYGPDEFNAAITKLNDTKTAALNMCDAAYR